MVCKVVCKWKLCAITTNLLDGNKLAQYSLREHCVIMWVISLVTYLYITLWRYLACTLFAAQTKINNYDYLTRD